MTWSQIATQPWMLWRRQVAAILRLELKKSLFSKRAWWIYILTLGPVVFTGLHSLFPGNGGHTIGEDNMIFAGIFQVYYLRLGIFFGCLGIFSNLFRAEVLDAPCTITSCRPCAVRSWYLVSTWPAWSPPSLTSPVASS